MTIYTGICYGFEVMRVAESPNTAFTLLYTRFKVGELESSL